MCGCSSSASSGVTQKTQVGAPSSQQRCNCAASLSPGAQVLCCAPAGIYGSQGRADFTVDDVEHYFNYMGMLAVEGTYDRMEEMLSSGTCVCSVCVECHCTSSSLDYAGRRGQGGGSSQQSAATQSIGTGLCVWTDTRARGRAPQ